MRLTVCDIKTQCQQAQGQREEKLSFRLGFTSSFLPCPPPPFASSSEDSFAGGSPPPGAAGGVGDGEDEGDDDDDGAVAAGVLESSLWKNGK